MILTIICKEPDMSNRAVRRHQETKVKRKLSRQYNSCIEELSATVGHGFEGNAEKLKKVCVPHYDLNRDRKLGKRTVQERRHDITMKEQLF